MFKYIFLQFAKKPFAANRITKIIIKFLLDICNVLYCKSNGGVCNVQKIYTFQPYFFIEKRILVKSNKFEDFMLVFHEYMVIQMLLICISIIQMSKVLVIGARLHNILGLARFNTHFLYCCILKIVSTI